MGLWLPERGNTSGFSIIGAMEPGSGPLRRYRTAVLDSEAQTAERPVQVRQVHIDERGCHQCYRIKATGQMDTE
jgi:hypothetical protein